MAEYVGEVLPYRGDVGDLFRVIEALGRGRSLEDVQDLDFSERTFQGTLATARALGFVDVEAGDLTETGERLALATDQSAKVEILLEQFFAYEPYGLLLEAVFDKGDVDETEIQWFETWWNRRNYGASQNNRSEGSGAFANLLEAVGLGQFVRGRRGRASRVVWSPNSGEVVRSHRYGTESTSIADERERITRPGVGREQSPANTNESEVQDSQRMQQGAPAGEHRLEINLSQGRRALVAFPTESLTPLDRRFLKAALEMALEYVGAIDDAGTG